jgi:hypothetical protein
MLAAAPLFALDSVPLDDPEKKEQRREGRGITGPFFSPDDDTPAYRQIDCIRTPGGA